MLVVDVMRYGLHFFDIVVACRRVIRSLVLLVGMWSCLISPRKRGFLCISSGANGAMQIACHRQRWWNLVCPGTDCIPVVK